jgi:MSHA pilin protein MshD
MLAPSQAPKNGLPQYPLGFTLLELVVGMLVLAISMTVLVSALAPMHQQSGAIWQQIRSAELAQALLSEIQGRAFDDNTPADGSLLRCDETGANACVATFPACPAQGLTALTEEAARADFDDVDDYHCFRASGDTFSDVLGQSMADSYRGYQLSVQLSYAGTEYGFASNRLVKKISLTVTAPDGTALLFNSLKGNW